jgi:hypothetical protein
MISSGHICAINSHTQRTRIVRTALGKCQNDSQTNASLTDASPSHFATKPLPSVEGRMPPRSSDEYLMPRRCGAAVLLIPRQLREDQREKRNPKERTIADERCQMWPHKFHRTSSHACDQHRADSAHLCAAVLALMACLKRMDLIIAWEIALCCCCSMLLDSSAERSRSWAGKERVRVTDPHRTSAPQKMEACCAPLRDMREQTNRQFTRLSAAWLH